MAGAKHQPCSFTVVKGSQKGGGVSHKAVSRKPPHEQNPFSVRGVARKVSLVGNAPTLLADNMHYP